MPVYLCGDTAPGLNTQNKQAMQLIAYEKKEGAGHEPNWDMGGIEYEQYRNSKEIKDFTKKSLITAQSLYT